MNKKCIIVNLFSGPGAGKSTTAAGLFHQLKILGLNCELVTEYAKHVTWRENFTTLKNQIYVFAKQHDKMFHLKDKVDVIITDSPIVLSLSYCDFNKVSKSLIPLVLDEFNRPEQVNLNYFMNRVNPYSTKGRTQTEEEAKEKDREVLALLNQYKVPYKLIDADEQAINKIVEDILKNLEITNINSTFA